MIATNDDMQHKLDEALAKNEELQTKLDQVTKHVCPACAGMIRSLDAPCPSTLSLPRMRGDDPHQNTPNAWTCMFAPHARG